METIPLQIFKTVDKTYRVLEKVRGLKLDKDYAYVTIHCKYVLPYRGKLEKLELAMAPGFYKYKGNYIQIFPKTEEDMELYHRDNIIALTTDSIFEKLVSTIDVPEIEVTDGDIFKPAIKDDDDIALAGMKYSIGKKKIDFNAYGKRFKDTGQKNNARRVLVDAHTLKMDMADRFSDVFDINYGLVFWDKEGCQNPMSTKNEVFFIANDSGIDLSSSDITIVNIDRNSK